MSTPDLSVVIVRFAGGSAVRHVLESLGAQGAASRIEVLVAHGPAQLPDHELRADYPAVRWVEADSDDPAAQRAAAVLVARAAIIACTEDHCVPDRLWTANILRAHARSRAAVIGGCIDKRVPDDALAWAAYVMDYGRYMPPVPAGPTTSCSDCNVSYKRDPLFVLEPEWAKAFRETHVHGALVARGEVLELDPAILVAQSRTIDPSTFFSERLAHGRTYGAQRAQTGSLAARVVRAARAAFIPLVFVQRGRQRVRAAGRMHEVPPGTWRVLARASAAWAVGEGLGELTRRGT